MKSAKSVKAARKPATRTVSVETYASVWDAIADTPEQAEAAGRCGVTQPRMNDLLRGRVSRFSLDALVNIATALGQKVHVELQAA